MLGINTYKRVLKKAGVLGVTLEEAKSLLLENEEIEDIITQNVPGKTQSVILTNDRLIVYTKDPVHSTFKDYFLRDVKDVRYSSKIGIGGKIVIIADRGNNVGKVDVSFLPLDESKVFYIKVQRIEKVWFSKKREMELEDKRASSGAANVVVGNSSATLDNDIEAKLTKLKSLKSKGLIDDETYKMKYSKLIDQL